MFDSKTEQAIAIDNMFQILAHLVFDLKLTEKDLRELLGDMVSVLYIKGIQDGVAK